ncbi:EF-hand domain-containing protein [Nitrobacter sp.]|uniref:EF-hand domain-containing protein n=1 Tax=Nitrobacter sp. TaxID=29420 RepID=UPI00399D67B8
MLFALGAVSSAIDAFQSLTSSASSKVETGISQSATASFDPVSDAASPTGPTASSGSGSGTCLSPATMSALLAAQGQSPSAPAADASSALQDLFSQIDGNGDGQIDKSEFESALGAGGTNLAQADDVFGKLDANGDGSVSLDEMASALKGAGGHGHGHGHHHVASSDGSSSAGGSSGASGGSSPDSLLAAVDSSSSITNSDGSVTTTTTLADGTQVTLTSPPSSSTSGAASSSYSLMQQAIQRETEAISASATQSLSVSV